MKIVKIIYIFLEYENPQIYTYIFFLLDYVLLASILDIFLMDIFSFKSIVNFDEFFIKHKNLIFGE